MGCSLPGSSVRGISRQEYCSGLPWSPPGDLRPRNRTWVSCIAGGFFTVWATTEDPQSRKPTNQCVESVRIGKLPFGNIKSKNEEKGYLPGFKISLHKILISYKEKIGDFIWRNLATATHSSTLAWKFPWTEECGGLQSMGLQRVRHDWETSLSLFTLMHWRRKWQPTPVFLPGESQGRGSLVGCHLWGRTESDTTEAT